MGLRIVCREQTIVWWEQTIVWRQQTIVWWEQTIVNVEYETKKTEHIRLKIKEQASYRQIQCGPLKRSARQALMRGRAIEDGSTKGEMVGLKV